MSDLGEAALRPLDFDRALLEQPLGAAAAPVLVAIADIEHPVDRHGAVVIDVVSRAVDPPARGIAGYLVEAIAD